jgi:hypothetical protein
LSFFGERRLLAIFLGERLLFTFLQERGIYNYKNKNFIKILAPFFVKKDGLKYESPVYAIFCFFCLPNKNIAFSHHAFQETRVDFPPAFCEKALPKMLRI